jgi:ABC-2 type transport system ATP-binding protein
MIKIEDMGFAYGRRGVLRDFNLHIKEGETTLITGINGTGKTTLLRLMAGVLFPQRGSIHYSEKLGPDPRGKIGFISDRMHLYENMTLSSAIRFHSRVYRIGEFDMSLMEQARLQPDQRIGDLSAGQKLIFHLGLILAAQPDILLIDEVIHSIDAFLREMFLNRLLECMAQRNVTLILVNLNYHDIENIPQRVILLKNGRVAVDEPIEDLKAKVKKLVSAEEISGIPSLYTRHYADRFEYYAYPFSPDLAARTKGGPKVVDLNLDEIIKAFIGGEYA